jgi:hypothetical protein
MMETPRLMMTKIWNIAIYFIFPWASLYGVWAGSRMAIFGCVFSTNLRQEPLKVVGTPSYDWVGSILPRTYR